MNTDEEDTTERSDFHEDFNEDDILHNSHQNWIDLNKEYDGCDDDMEQSDVDGHFQKPISDDYSKPYVNQTFNSLDEAFEYYKEYGRRVGFDIRRSSSKKYRDGRMYIKYFVCSNAGVCDSFQDMDESTSAFVSHNSDINNIKRRDETSDLDKRRRRTASSKCNCNAKLVLKAVDTNGFKVTIFEEAHNHPLASESGKQFLRCSRVLSTNHMNFIFNAAKANIGATRAFNLYKVFTGSYSDVGATANDFKNFSRDYKKYIGKRDSDMILRRFKDKHETSDKAFRYEYETDADGDLTRIFWTDAIGRRNYEVFGDVISFDATYRTNKYSMIFVPFVGIDNHWKSVTFAAALLSKEDTTNYGWVFDVFLKVMGRPPNCIVTDQCPAMKAVIPLKFPGSSHRLCMWHIMKKFPPKLGTVFCAESPFMEKLGDFVWSDHASPIEFEDGWKAVLLEFGLEDNSWLAELFEIRKSWIPAYFMNEPMTGLIRTTSRSESSNFYFNHFLQKGDSLVEFFVCYESAIERQLHNNARLNQDDCKRPKLITSRKIEKDASEQYTHAIFYKVQDEIKAACSDMVLENINVVEDVKTFTIKDPRVSSKKFQVQLNMVNTTVQCSCTLYIRMGYLCRHSFFCLNICGIHEIPRSQLNNRWLKNAEERHTTLYLGEVSDYCKKEAKLQSLRTESWFEFQGCISEAAGDEELVSLVFSTVKELRAKLKDRRCKNSVQLREDVIRNMIGIDQDDHITVGQPKGSNNKGCRKRILSSAEKSANGRKRTARSCKYCKGKEVFHDSRNCPQKLKANVHLEQETQHGSAHD